MIARSRLVEITAQPGYVRRMRRTTLALVLLLACGCAGSFGRRTAAVRTFEPAPVRTSESDLVHTSEPIREAPLEDFLASRRDPGVPAEPRIGPGDVIRVDVADVDEASREYSVTKAGTVRLPLAGEVDLSGKSTEEAGAAIEERLEPFVVTPSARVRLLDVKGSEATIVGAVERPGRIRLGLKGKTLLDALSAAGGLTSDASGTIRITPGTSAPPGLFADDAPGILSAEPIELAAADVVRANGPVRLYLRPGDHIEVVSKSGAVASVAIDSLEELDPPAAKAPPVEAEEEELTLVERERPKAEPASRSRRDRAEAQLGSKRAAQVPELTGEPLAGAPAPKARRGASSPPSELPARARSVAARGKPAPSAESAELLAELEALRRRIEAHEVESQTQVRREKGESANQESEVEAARAEAEEARRRFDAERKRADALSARLAELEADRGGDSAAMVRPSTPSPPTTVILREKTTAPESEAGRGGLFSIFGFRDDESEPEELAATKPAPVSARPPSHAPPSAPPRSVELRRAAPSPAKASANGRIDVVGRVENEGNQPLADARTVSSAVARAELAPGADVSRIEVRRGSGNEEWRILVNLLEVQGGRSPDVMLEDGDTIVVP